jgi:hypothetical protein
MDCRWSIKSFHARLERSSLCAPFPEALRTFTLARCSLQRSNSFSGRSRRASGFISKYQDRKADGRQRIEITERDCHAPEPHSEARDSTVRRTASRLGTARSPGRDIRSPPRGKQDRIKPPPDSCRLIGNDSSHVPSMAPTTSAVAHPGHPKLTLPSDPSSGLLDSRAAMPKLTSSTLFRLLRRFAAP